MPNEAFLYIPNKCIISVLHAQQSEIGAIFLNPQYESLFVTHQYREDITLVVYVLYELLKGESSFYAPYLNHCQLDDLPPLWEETQSWDRLEDGVLKTKLKLTRD
jgi:hypothetical protein